MSDDSAPAPAPAGVLTASPTMELCFVVTTANASGSIDLRADATVTRILSAWPEARISSLSVTGIFAAQDDLVVAALARRSVDGRALALAPGLITTRSSDTATASTNRGPVPAGVDPELVGPLTVGAAAHLCWTSELHASSYGVVRLHVVPGGVAVFDALPVAASPATPASATRR